MEGKCDAIFFCKRDGRTIFHGYLFFKKPFRAWYCQRIFPDNRNLLSFLFFFLIPNLRNMNSRNFDWWGKLLMMTALKAVGRNGKDSDMDLWILGTKTYDCARWRKCIDGREKRFFRIRKVNAGYILEELGRGLAKWGNRIAEKWWGSTGSPTENLYLDNCLKKWL